MLACFPHFFLSCQAVWWQGALFMQFFVSKKKTVMNTFNWGYARQLNRTWSNLGISEQSSPRTSQNKSSFPQSQETVLVITQRRAVVIENNDVYRFYRLIDRTGLQFCTVGWGHSLKVVTLLTCIKPCSKHVARSGLGLWIRGGLRWCDPWVCTFSAVAN